MVADDGSGKPAQQPAVKGDLGELLHGAEAISGIATDAPREQARQPKRRQAGENKGGGSSGDVRNTTAASQTATPGQAESTLDEDYRYDPTKYQFNKGARSATAWSYN